MVGAEPNLSLKSDFSASESASLLSDDCDGSVLGEASEKTVATNLLRASNETPQYLIYQGAASAFAGLSILTEDELRPVFEAALETWKACLMSMELMN